MAVRLCGGTAVALFTAGTVLAYQQRSRPSQHREHHERQAELASVKEEALPKDATLVRSIDRKLMDFAGGITMASLGSMAETFLRVGHRVVVLNREALDKYTASTRDGRPLITVCNHDSVLDDPFIMSLMTPLSVLARPAMMRMGVCSEELCFGHAALSTFFGLGNGLPMQRGGTIHQSAIARLQRRANAGGWVHLFAEGRVWQEVGSPLRDAAGRWCTKTGRCVEPFSKVGPLKWGLAKLIANCSTPPVIVPFFHMGMEHVMPQDFENQLKGIVPAFGFDITAAVGDPVDVTDLITAYHEAAKTRASLRAKSSTNRSGVQPPPFRVDTLSQDGGVVPTRKNEFGVAVPAYVEEPLLIKPPDHDSLSPEESMLEEAFRLQLYSAICDRLWVGLHAAEVKVREYRRAVLGLAELDDEYLFISDKKHSRPPSGT